MVACEQGNVEIVKVILAGSQVEVEVAADFEERLDPEGFEGGMDPSELEVDEGLALTKTTLSFMVV